MKKRGLDLSLLNKIVDIPPKYIRQLVSLTTKLAKQCLANSRILPQGVTNSSFF